MKKRKLISKSSKPRRINGLALLDELCVSGLSRAVHSHMEELSYEMLKDPDYQEWMSDWAEGFLSALLEGFRRRRAARRKNRKALVPSR